ncbi:MAG TPA: protein kinase [bacterium]|nr:protein kinase [bacterium]
MQKFNLLQKIGEGSFGEVWKAAPADGEEVALKYLRLDRNSPGFAAAVLLFKREFELLCELKHAHLARVLDFGFDESRSQYYFASEYCEGLPISEASRGRPLSWFEDALVQILSALDCIHSQGVVHLDLKPENILVQCREGKPFAKIIDFGVATRLQQGSSQGIGGSPAYMAPELFSAEPRIDPRMDLYSLGMLCLETLGGGLPFDQRQQREALDWHRRGSVPEKLWAAAALPAYQRELISNLLAKSPSDRFSSARAVLNFMNLATGGRYRDVEAEFHKNLPKEGPLVGRSELLRELRETLSRIFAPDSPARSELRFFCGERGIGKSRLLQEIRQMAALQEVPVFSLTCDWEISSWPKLAEAIGLPALAQDNLNEDWQRRRKVDCLREAAAARPFCLLIDDFHKADPEFRQTIEAMAVRDPALPASGHCFIAVATKDELEQGTRLKRLDREAVREYAEKLLGKTERSAGLAGRLGEYSGGLPLLMTEGLRYLADHAGSDAAGETAWPPELAGIYRERLAALAPEEREILNTVALVFQPVAEAELAAMLGLSPETLHQRAKEMLRGELLEQVAEAGKDRLSYRMASQALGLELIAMLDPEARSGFHRRIARGMMSRASASNEELGYHLAKAGMEEEAARRYREAGEKFLGRGEIASASRCLSKAQRLLAEGGEAWLELCLESARLATLTGQFRLAEEQLAKLEPYGSWKVCEQRGWLHFKRRDFSAAQAHYSEALASLPEGKLQERISIENALANTDLQCGRYEEAAERFRRTLVLEDSLPPEDRKFSNNGLGLALVLKGEAAEALAFYETRARQYFGRLKPEDEIALLNAKAYVNLQAGRYEEAISTLKRAMALAEQTGAMHALTSIMGNLITALLKESRYAESLPLLQKILAFQQRMGSARDVAYSFVRQGSIYLTLGMGESARSCFDSGRHFLAQTQDPGLAVWYSLMDGYWEREHGDPVKAEELFRRTAEEARAIGSAEIVSWADYARADLAYDRMDFAACQRLLGELRPPGQDKEFSARLHLLQAKLAAARSGADGESLFAGVESECRDGHFREILCELYHNWALARSRRQGTEAALPLLQQGVQIVESIVGSLPEEYRRRYLSQWRRKKLYEDLAAFQSSPKGLGSKLRGFLGRLSGRA